MAAAAAIAYQEGVERSGGDLEGVGGEWYRRVVQESGEGKCLFEYVLSVCE